MKNMMWMEAEICMDPDEIRMLHKKRQQNGKEQLKFQMQGGTTMQSTIAISALEVKDSQNIFLLLLVKVPT